jgi:hypothetical protein
MCLVHVAARSACVMRDKILTDLTGALSVLSALYPILVLFAAQVRYVWPFWSSVKSIWLFVIGVRAGLSCELQAVRLRLRATLPHGPATSHVVWHDNVVDCDCFPGSYCTVCDAGGRLDPWVMLERHRYIARFDLLQTWFRTTSETRMVAFRSCTWLSGGL